MAASWKLRDSAVTSLYMGSFVESTQEKLGRVTMKWPLHTDKGQILPHPILIQMLKS